MLRRCKKFVKYLEVSFFVPIFASSKQIERAKILSGGCLPSPKGECFFNLALTAGGDRSTFL